MSNHFLPVGMILQNRYEIEAVLGEGSFGITYACRCLWSQQAVAIKEMFWSRAMVRDSRNGTQVVLIDSVSADTITKMMDRFLFEARALVQFNREPSVVHVLDYFQANGTAYMVTELVKGVTLESYLDQVGLIPAEKIFTLLPPLLDGLYRIHQAGFLHRDISTDNLILQPEGLLKLMDFGAVHEFSRLDSVGVSQYIKDGFSPLEQYSSPEKLVPASDLYALSAVIYRCVTGKMPDSPFARSVKDEVRWPSQLGIEISPNLENVLKKGLALYPEDRFQSALEMKKAVKEALPREIPQRKKKFQLYVVISGIVAMTALVILWRLFTPNAADPFSGRKTQQIFLEYPQGFTLEDRRDAKDFLQDSLSEFSDQCYTLEELSEGFLATVPLDAFGQQEIAPQIEANFLSPFPDTLLSYRYQIQAEWLAPEGDNQVERNELTGTVVLLETDSGSYDSKESEFSDDDFLQRGKICERLDILDVPYALGILYGTSRQYVIAIGAEHLGESVILLLGENYAELSIKGIWEDMQESSFLAADDFLTILKADDGQCGLSLSLDCEDVLQELAERNEEKVYLMLNNSPVDILCRRKQIPLASCDLTDYAAGEPLEFWDFLLKDNKMLGESMEWFLHFIKQCISGEKLQSTFSVTNMLLLDCNGQPLWEQDPVEVFGLKGIPSIHGNMLKDLEEELQSDNYDARLQEKELQIFLHLPASTTMLEAGIEGTVNLITEYDMAKVSGKIKIFLWDPLYEVIDGTVFITKYSCIELTDSFDMPGKIMTASVVDPHFGDVQDRLTARWKELSFEDLLLVGDFMYTEKSIWRCYDVFAGEFQSLGSVNDNSQ